MPIRIFCARTPPRLYGHFGFGLTTDGAVQQFLRAGGKAHDIPKLRMHELPQGIIDYGIDEMGGIFWKFPDSPEGEKLAETGQITTLHYSPNRSSDQPYDHVLGDWCTCPAPPSDKKLLTYTVKFKMFGAVEIAAENEEAARYAIEYEMDARDLCRLMEFDEAELDSKSISVDEGMFR